MFGDDDLDGEKIDVEYIAEENGIVQEFQNDFILNDNVFEEERVAVYDNYGGTDEDVLFAPTDTYGNAEGGGFLTNHLFYDANYYNIEEDLTSNTVEDLTNDSYENALVEPVYTEERLEEFPEMNQLPSYSAPSLPSRPTRPSSGPEKTNSASGSKVSLPSERPSGVVLQRDLEAPEPIRPPLLITKQNEVPGNQAPPKMDPLQRLPLTPLPDHFFKKRFTLNSHQTDLASDCVRCEICGFCFRYRKSYVNHLRKHQATGEQKIFSDKIGLVCPIKYCTSRCDTMATVIQHLTRDHKIGALDFEKIYFRSMQEFEDWRAALERLTFSRFIKSGRKMNMHSKAAYYRCHHSCLIPDPTENKHRIRETKKIGRTCTAFFHIHLNDNGEIMLRGCLKHMGHGLSVQLLPLTDEIRMEIALLLVEGYNEWQIVNKLRNESTNIDRRHYVRESEVRNLALRIEKTGEGFKRKIAAGEALPELAKVVTGGGCRQKVKLASASVPTYEGNPAPILEEEGMYKGLEEEDTYEQDFYSQERHGQYNKMEEYDQVFPEADTVVNNERKLGSTLPKSSTKKRQSKEGETVQKPPTKKRVLIRRVRFPKIVPEGWGETDFEDMNETPKTSNDEVDDSSPAKAPEPPVSKANCPVNKKPTRRAAKK